MVFDLYAVVSTFAVKRAHNFIGSFFRCLFFYFACVCNHCHWTSQNRRSKMGLTSHLSCFHDAFYSYRVSFSLMTIMMMISLMTILTMIFMGPVYLVSALFHFLKIPFVVSMDYFHLVESLEYFHLFESIGIFSFSRVNDIF